MDNSTHTLAPSTSGDRLALQIREALGPLNDDELPVVELVRRLAAERATSEAQVPVAATLDDAATDPALTLDVARELLRDAAAGIRSLAASATPRTEPRSTHRVHRGNEWLPCYCAADFDHKVGHEQERVEAAEGREAVRGSTLRFGLGAWIVNTGTYDGEPCVFIDDAPTWGKVGERAPDVPQGVKPFIRLLFPTAEQATAVQLALTTPPAGDGARVTLAAKWRQRADQIEPSPECPGVVAERAAARAEALRDCADELEAALAARDAQGGSHA